MATEKLSAEELHNLATHYYARDVGKPMVDRLLAEHAAQARDLEQLRAAARDVNEAIEGAADVCIENWQDAKLVRESLNALCCLLPSEPAAAVQGERSCPSCRLTSAGDICALCDGIGELPPVQPEAGERVSHDEAEKIVAAGSFAIGDKGTVRRYVAQQRDYGERVRALCAAADDNSADWGSLNRARKALLAEHPSDCGGAEGGDNAK